MYVCITVSASAKPEDFGPVGWQVNKDTHERDLDAKIIITSHNSKPGLGKTTLAIRFARALDPHGWSAEDKAFIDPYDYMRAYDNVKPGSVLILDEIEAVADKRRSNASENVDLSQAWATKRYRNIVTIATLPTTSMLDARMIELSDYRINVMRRGAAKAFEVVIPDFPPHRPWQEPVDGMIHYRDLPEGDADYKHLTELKEEFTKVDRTTYKQHEVDKIKERVVRETRKELRDELIRKFYKNTDVSQTDVSDVVDVSQAQVNRIINSE